MKQVEQKNWWSKENNQSFCANTYLLKIILFFFCIFVIYVYMMHIQRFHFFCLFNLQIKHHQRRHFAEPNFYRTIWVKRVVSQLLAHKTPYHYIFVRGNRTDYCFIQVSYFYICGFLCNIRLIYSALLLRLLPVSLLVFVFIHILTFLDLYQLKDSLISLAIWFVSSMGNWNMLRRCFRL